MRAAYSSPPVDSPSEPFQPSEGPLLHNMLLEAELVRIAREFREASVDFVVLKGVPLTRRLHERLDARTMVDNDILVHRRDTARAVQCLLGLGYRPPEFHTIDGDLRSTFQSA